MISTQQFTYAFCYTICLVRALWRHYYQNTQVCMFVIDSNDRERIGEAKEQLHIMMSEDELRDCILIVLANKQDLPNAMNVKEIYENLDFEKLRTNRKTIIATCATSGDGLNECMDWMAMQYELKTLKAPINETIEDVKQLVTKTNNNYSNYFYNYVESLNKFVSKMIGNEKSVN